MSRNSRILVVLSILWGCGQRVGGSGGGGDDGVWTSDTDAGSSGPMETTSAAEGGSTLGEDEGTAGDSTGGEIECGEASYRLEAIPPNVVLVLDKSGSMVANTWDHDDDGSTPEITRWASLHSVVESVVASFDATIHFGAVLFPSLAARAELGDAACVVGDAPEVPVTPSSGEDILDVMPAAEATDLEGATPATAGVSLAIEHLLGLDPEIPRALVLVTDGAANCGADLGCNYPDACPLLEAYDAELAVAVAQAWVEEQIPTYVVGIDIADVMSGVGIDGSPEANAWVELNAVAAASGTARPGPEKFYNTGSEVELRSALSSITDAVVSCEIVLDPPPTHPDYVDIEIGGAGIDHVTDCAAEDGWVFAAPSGPYESITLCGAACDRLKAVGELRAIYGCPPAG